MIRLLSFFLCLLAVTWVQDAAGTEPTATQVSGQAATDDVPSGSFPAAVLDSLVRNHGLQLVDTTLYYADVIEVPGAALRRVAEPARIELDALTVSQRDAGSVAELAPLLPGTRQSVNSRGESQFMVRGASERHLRLSWDGMPLNVPWDERTDLGLVPAGIIGGGRGAGGMVGVLGVGGVLDGANALAGAIDLAPTAPFAAGSESPGRDTRLVFRAGQAEQLGLDLSHRQNSGNWSWQVGLTHRERAGFLLPGDFTAPFNQTGRIRTNSDLEQNAVLLRAGRALAGRGSVRLSVFGADGSKGVPPETHLADGARYWRYPLVRRGMVGLALDLPPAAAGGWDLQFRLSFDSFRQEIRAYDDASYSNHNLAVGDDFETDQDRTGFFRWRMTRPSGESGWLAWQVDSRYSRHRETDIVGGPEQRYAQWLGSLVVETAFQPAVHWRQRIGAGFEFADTPETGDVAARKRRDAVVAHWRLERAVGQRSELSVALSRRSRFPAMRELFSGALGRFIPNPDLVPERQDLLELGFSTGGDRWQLAVIGFAGWLDGAIEKVVVGSTRQYTRVNRDHLRNLGLELVGEWRPHPGWTVSAHHTVLQVRSKVNDRFTGPAEDRPDYLSYLALGWVSPAGPSLALELEGTGPRFSADVTDEQDGLRRLPASASVNLRAGYALSSSFLSLDHLELFLRLNNLLDDTGWSQVGLPTAGRMIAGGVKAAVGQ
ncbi:MAG: TonB-dependent receptor [bacterium]